MQKIPRNKACPCGSRRKYKACCGAAAGRLSPRTDTYVPVKLVIAASLSGVACLLVPVCLGSPLVLMALPCWTAPGTRRLSQIEREKSNSGVQRLNLSLIFLHLDLMQDGLISEHFASDHFLWACPSIQGSVIVQKVAWVFILSPLIISLIKLSSM